jgi:hypothetical protein
MIQIDIQPLRQRLLPETDWRPWKKPNPTLEIDKWVSKQGLQRGDLPAHFEQEGCPYWYVRRGLITAVQEAQRHAAAWTEKRDRYIVPDKLISVPATKPEAIAATLSRYEAEATSIASAINDLNKLIGRFLQTHLGVDGRLYEFDHVKEKSGLIKPEIDFAEALVALQPLVPKLQSISDIAITAREPWINNPSDVWKHTFVAHLGLLFSDITKKPPKNSGPFQKFIDDAWVTLASGHDENFAHTIVKVTQQFRQRQKPHP